MIHPAAPAAYLNGHWGLALVFLGLFLEETNKPAPGEHLEAWKVIGLKLINHLGIAAISIGFVGLILEVRDWQNYFQEQLASTILKRDYIDTLERTELLDLQKKTWKAYYKNANIDREGGFLEYFDRKRHQFIGSPYREGADMEMVLRNSPGRPDLFDVNETISYRCRKMGQEIQNEVKWGSVLDYEVEKIKSFRITVRLPVGLAPTPELLAKFPDLCDSVIVVEAPIGRPSAVDTTVVPPGEKGAISGTGAVDPPLAARGRRAASESTRDIRPNESPRVSTLLADVATTDGCGTETKNQDPEVTHSRSGEERLSLGSKTTDPAHTSRQPETSIHEASAKTSEKVTRLQSLPKGKGYTLSLEGLQHIDGLLITVEVEYTAPRDALFTWTMSHSTKNMRAMVSYPDSLVIHHDRFGVEDGEYEERLKPGVYSITCHTWLLPQTGVAFHLIDQGEKQRRIY